ncbi:hypothetical protein SARC_10973 [Sphaeroforma arctica JP610]|uniref:Phosphatidic acid phosphatase type 2/haloperoxidase domain-containing protein n=1 Tax=Sphaeroforma arctica JP610 TaxID=667725 RepID=A0A0L0FKI0_9EUKA|nr:hypothetical protein SARC_10973 [Sphaeroforma arctica JP610]KNC76528.1 hypothetical protein SARC_10973 [Sphaeroforma arctica JP610]|eukprot:XP_014150430.1 hypothetical protein SARC_10973 [Sphaeroforma arctica JP610]
MGFQVNENSGNYIRQWLHDHISEPGTDTVRQLQRVQSWPLTLMAEGMSLLSDEIGYIVLIPFALQYPQYFHLIALHVTNLMLMCFTVGNQLKDRLRLPRPRQVQDAVLLLQHKDEQDFGFPSTHTSAATLIGGFVLSPITCIITVIVMAYSRMYLGVHSLTDTVGGVLYSVPLLFWYMSIADQLEAYYISGSCIYDICTFLISVIIIYSHPDPNTMNGKSTRDWTIVCASLAFGMQLGSRYRSSPIDMSTAIDLSTIVTCYVLDMLVVGSIRLVLKPILKPLVPPVVAKYIVYGALGLYMAMAVC